MRRRLLCLLRVGEMRRRRVVGGGCGDGGGDDQDHKVPRGSDSAKNKSAAHQDSSRSCSCHSYAEVQLLLEIVYDHL
ncbi:hypothetical protein E2C01_037125 [Portunus trituberculatus]|uniref:Uncharacterized protein n=1 Tax=Portunus trituberculatus TaxID=210409 RepID=A0A5B7FDT3_PORTR|nr:hypothetical protein [Portunus trituberculatus]